MGKSVSMVRANSLITVDSCCSLGMILRPTSCRGVWAEYLVAGTGRTLSGASRPRHALRASDVWWARGCEGGAGESPVGDGLGHVDKAEVGAAGMDSKSEERALHIEAG